MSGLPCPPAGDLSHSGTEPESLMSPELADEYFTTSITWVFGTEEQGRVTPEVHQSYSRGEEMSHS